MLIPTILCQGSIDSSCKLFLCVQEDILLSRLSNFDGVKGQTSWIYFTVLFMPRRCWSARWWLRSTISYHFFFPSTPGGSKNWCRLDIEGRRGGQYISSPILSLPQVTSRR